MSGLSLEVWFPQQDEVTVFLESSIGDPDEERFVECWLFALYAARQFANLRGEPTLAAALASTEPASPLPGLEAKLSGVRVSSPAAASGGGRKGFTARMRSDSRTGAFNLKGHGFGMLGRGVDYYAPTSTLALVVWLLRRRRDDPHYQRALGLTAQLIGLAAANGHVTVRSQAEIAAQATAEAWRAAGAEQESSAYDDLPADAAAAVERLGIDFSRLVDTIDGQIEQAVEGRAAEPGQGWMVPVALGQRICRFETLAAAEPDPRVVEQALSPALAAVSAARASGDSATIDAADAHYDRELVRLVDERGLGPVVSALTAAVFSSPPGEE